ncbi:hypothetical protein ABBQ38_009664 [Trebouxia sp. C0009 RCD-2024]
MELFLGKLCEGTAAVASNSHARTATPGHLKAYVASNSKMDFLVDKVAAVPDFGEDEAAPAKKQRPDSELASSSSGLQLSGAASPPSSSKGIRGRGRGRTRGRGSMRLVAPDSRIATVKDEQASAQTAQSMPNVAPANIVKACSDAPTKPEVDAVDTTMPQAEASQLEPLSTGVQPPDTAPAADVLAIKREQHAMHARAQQQMPPCTEAPASQQPQGLPVSQQQVADMPFLTAAATLKRSDTVVEEDDYDADDC